MIQINAIKSFKAFYFKILKLRNRIINTVNFTYRGTCP